MADDPTWGAKVSPELKEEISQLVKSSGLSSKDLLEQMVFQYKVGLSQESDTTLKHEDIKQVAHYLEKIKNSFVGIVEKNQALANSFAESEKKESALHKEIVDQQQMAIKQAQEERDRVILDKSALAKTMADITARNEELEEINTSQRITIQMQMDKLTQLESRIESVQAMEEKVNRMNEENMLQTKKNESLEHESRNHKRELEITLASKEAQEKEAARTIESLKETHKLLTEKTILEIEKRSLEEMQELRETFREEMRSLTDRNDGITKQIHDLQLKLQKLTPAADDPHQGQKQNSSK